MGYGCSEDWSVSKLSDKLIEEVDVAIVPIDTSNPKNLVKSANRITLTMSLGIPTIATPISSYRCVSENYKGTVLFAEYNDIPKWIENINFLRNLEKRNLTGSLSRNAVIERYSMETSVKEWVLAFLELF